MFEVSPAAKSLRFPPSQKQRATYPVGFFPSPPPSSLGRLYRGDRPVRLYSAASAQAPRSLPACSVQPLRYKQARKP